MSMTCVDGKCAIIYVFVKKGCPPCDAMDKEIAKLKANYGGKRNPRGRDGIHFITVQRNTQEHIFRMNNVFSTPTILIKPAGSPGVVIDYSGPRTAAAIVSVAMSSSACSKKGKHGECYIDGRQQMLWTNPTVIIPSY